MRDASGRRTGQRLVVGFARLGDCLGRLGRGEDGNWEIGSDERMDTYKVVDAWDGCLACVESDLGDAPHHAQDIDHGCHKAEGVPSLPSVSPALPARLGSRTPLGRGERVSMVVVSRLCKDVTVFIIP